MANARITEGRFGGKVVTVNIPLEIYVSDSDEEIGPFTEGQVIDMLDDCERIRLGEMVLNMLDKATVVTG